MWACSSNLQIYNLCPKLSKSMSKITNNYCFLLQCVIGNKVAMKKKKPVSGWFLFHSLVLDNLEFLEHVADGVWMLVLVIVQCSQN